MTVYELNNVECGYGEFAFRADRCRLEKGRVYAITGPNGCGKSTLLNLLGFLCRPRRGEVTFRGRQVNYGDPAQLVGLRRKIGYLLQNPYLFNMTVRENVAYGLNLRGLPRDDVDNRVNRIMERLSLTRLAGKRAHALSGGEAQRVALARTLAIECDIYLLDEPTANVDQRHVHAFEEWITEMNTAGGATIVVSTHALEQAYRLSRTPISILNGRIHEIRYENVFSGTLTVEADGVRMVSVKPGVVLHTAQGKAGRATIAVDPQDILLSTQELQSSALNHFAGQIVKIEDVNGSLRVFVDVGIVLCALVTRRSFANMGLNIGERVWATFKGTAVKVI